MLTSCSLINPETLIVTVLQFNTLSFNDSSECLKLSLTVTEADDCVNG